MLCTIFKLQLPQIPGFQGLGALDIMRQFSQAILHIHSIVFYYAIYGSNIVILIYNIPIASYDDWLTYKVMLSIHTYALWWWVPEHCSLTILRTIKWNNNRGARMLNVTATCVLYTCVTFNGRKWQKPYRIYAIMWRIITIDYNGRSLRWRLREATAAAAAWRHFTTPPTTWLLLVIPTTINKQYTHVNWKVKFIRIVRQWMISSEPPQARETQ